MEFQYPEDKSFFVGLLCDGDVKKFDANYKDYFDFRSPHIKRKEFNKIRDKLLIEIRRRYSKKCQLNLSNNCKINRDLVVDHFIPLSSNKLNKILRKMKPKKDKKVKTQSFGSNNIENLILACDNCNNLKKHRFIKDNKIYL